jgi:tetratricopeptide (TPR) repeat protein
VLILRIKQAECALADGRLDEAFEIARADDVRRHRHGQRLAGRLTRALIQRGQTSLDADQLQPALADCDKAEKLGGNLPEIARLRAAVCVAMTRQQQGRQQEALRVAQAKKHIADGWHSVGEQILGDAAADDAQAQLVRQELAVARLQTDDAVAKAEQALQQGDIETAVDLIRAAGVLHSRNDRVGSLLRQINRLAAEQVRSRIEQGRIDRAQSLLQRLTGLNGDGEEISDLRRALTQCHEAAEFVAAGNPGAALPLLRKAKAICPSARWLDKVLADVRQAVEAMAELDAGPLGLSIAEASPCGLESRRMANPKSEIPNPKFDGAGSEELPSEFVMQMDGIGSYLVFRQARVTVGPISSSARPMLGLMAEPGLPVISIERLDGDYFVRSEQAIEVNGQPTKEKLLADGDAIALSPRCRLRFRLPNAASPTALLMLSGARLGRPDIRHVILMGRDILVGPYTNDHVQTEHLDENVTFFVQNERLLCRAAQPVSVGERPMQPSVGLTVGAPIRVGSLSMVLTRFQA